MALKHTMKPGSNPNFTPSMSHLTARKFTDDECRDAFRIFMQLFERHYGKEPKSVTTLSDARKATLFSIRSVAARLKVDPSNYHKWELAEENLSLKRMRACAEAMGCKLIISIVPGHTTFRERVWQAVLKGVWDETNVKYSLDPNRAKWIARKAWRALHTPEFRRRMRWGQNNNSAAYDVISMINMERIRPK